MVGYTSIRRVHAGSNGGWHSFSSCRFLATCLGLPCLRFFHAFSSVVMQMPGYNSQRWGTAPTLPKSFVLFYVLFVVSFCVFFVCNCVLYYCHRVTTQLQFNKYIKYIKKACVCKLRHLYLYSCPEDNGGIFPRSVGILRYDYEVAILKAVI